jgi:hypothetical protein
VTVSGHMTASTVMSTVAGQLLDAAEVVLRFGTVMTKDVGVVTLPTVVIVVAVVPKDGIFNTLQPA